MLSASNCSSFDQFILLWSKTKKLSSYSSCDIIILVNGVLKVIFSGCIVKCILLFLLGLGLFVSNTPAHCDSVLEFYLYNYAIIINFVEFIEK